MPASIHPKQFRSEGSEEITDIIERMPSRFSRIVIGIVILLFIALVAFGYFVKYPDVITGAIKLSNRNSPVKLVCPFAGNIEILHDAPGGIVEENQYIAIIHNPAITSDVQRVDSLLKTLNVLKIEYGAHRNLFPSTLALGELNDKYFQFLASLYQYLDFFKQRPFVTQKKTLMKLTQSQRDALAEQFAEYERLKVKYFIALNLFKKDSILFAEKLIPESEMEKARMTLISFEEEYKVQYKDIINGQFQLADADNKIQLLKIQNFDKERELHVSVLNNYFGLREGIKLWEQRYVIKSPVKGILEFLSYVKSNDYVLQNQEIFSILPARSDLVGQTLVPATGIGKVRNGQRVIIKLDNYPYTQFGSLKGEVSSISQVANEQIKLGKENNANLYLVNVKLPEGLKTNYGTKLNFVYDLKGTAEIVTDERRLIERFFSNLRFRLTDNEN